MSQAGRPPEKPKAELKADLAASSKKSVLDSPSSRTSTDRERRGSSDSDRKDGKDPKDSKDAKDGKEGKEGKGGSRKGAKEQSPKEAKEPSPKEAADGELSPVAQAAVAAGKEPAAGEQAAGAGATGADSPKDGGKVAGPPKVSSCLAWRRLHDASLGPCAWCAQGFRVARHGAEAALTHRADRRLPK